MGSFFKAFLKAFQLKNNDFAKRKGLLFSNLNKSSEDSTVAHSSKMNASGSMDEVGAEGFNSQLIFLPNIRSEFFQVPKYVPQSEWIHSQLYEILYNMAGFIDLVAIHDPKNCLILEHMVDSLQKNLDSPAWEVEKIFAGLFEIIVFLYEKKSSLLLELKLEAHLNSLLIHTAELCTQLPKEMAAVIFEATSANNPTLDMSTLRKALDHIDSRSLSRHGSDSSE